MSTDPEAITRRLDNRKIDRKAQRAGLERTERRIARFEEMVKHFSLVDINVEMLWIMARSL